MFSSLRLPQGEVFMESKNTNALDMMSNLKINTQALLQLEKQDIAKLKNIVLELKNKHLQILAQAYEFRQQHELESKSYNN